MGNEVGLITTEAKIYGQSSEFPSPMGNEVGLISALLASSTASGILFPSPMGNEVGLIAPFWRAVFPRALEPICG